MSFSKIQEGRSFRAFEQPGYILSTSPMSAETTSFIIDVSPLMVKEGHISKVIAYLEYALLDKCKRLRKTDWISCYLVNCQQKKNSQDISGIYQVQSFLAPVITNDVVNILKTIQAYADKLHSEHFENEIDDQQLQSMIQCLLVASIDIRDQFKSRKLLRQIVVFTNDLNGLDLTPNEIDVLREELTSRIVLVDCSKDTTSKAIMESKWGLLLKAIDGSQVYDINELLLDITSAKPSIVKPVRIFSGELRLGSDPVALRQKEFDSNADSKCISIQVEGYPATKQVSSLNRKTVLKAKEGDSLRYEPVKSVVEYEVDDEKSEKKISVSRDSIAKAFRYGSDYVVLPSTLDEQRLYKTDPGLDIRGFLDRTKLQRFYLNFESRFILADSKVGNLADLASFDALVDVMLAHDKVAIARYVPKVDAEVQMCVLCPLLLDASDELAENDTKPNFVRTLILCRLPFAEDERVSDFPRLLNRTTTSGKKIDTGNDQDTIDKLMSQYVDSLDLDEQGYEMVPDSKYYSMLDPTVKDTSLPLPHYSDDVAQKADPLRIPAIHIHRQQQVLLEYVHQKLISKSANFVVPDLPDSLRAKITPHLDAKKAKSFEELVDLLAIKKINKERLRSDELYETDQDDNIPSFEAIMAKGAR